MMKLNVWFWRFSTFKLVIRLLFSESFWYFVYNWFLVQCVDSSVFSRVSICVVRSPNFRPSYRFKPISGVKAAGFGIINSDCLSMSRYSILAVFRPSNFKWFLILRVIVYSNQSAAIISKSYLQVSGHFAVGDPKTITILVRLPSVSFLVLI